jgi:hypothetical protein
MSAGVPSSGGDDLTVTMQLHNQQQQIAQLQHQLHQWQLSAVVAATVEKKEKETDRALEAQVQAVGRAAAHGAGGAAAVPDADCQLYSGTVSTQGSTGFFWVQLQLWQLGGALQGVVAVRSEHGFCN